MPRTRKAARAGKPYPDFPLFLHASGQWAKKVRQKMFYFGTDPDAARAKWLAQRDDLLAGRTPRAGADQLSVRDLCNRFLTSKKVLVDAGELSPRTWRDYHDCCETMVGAFGRERAVADLASDDFEQLRAALAKKRGPVALGNEIQRVRTVLKYAFDEGLIERTVRFGTTFKKPNRKAMRRARQAGGGKMIEAAELRRVLGAARQPLKAMILLGLNCGFGQSDVANLPRAAVDLAGGWIDFPRPKTAVPRRCPLWPETVAAVREALPGRPDPKDTANADLMFVTKYGQKWVRTRPREQGGAVPIDAVGLEFNKLLTAIGLKRRGLGFYALRHVFRTVADTAKDQPAADALMGHVPGDDDMSSHYRERIADDRLQAVVDVVRAWLWPAAEARRPRSKRG